MSALDYDVLIVGGGIAGISIAERVSRDAARRGGHVAILVVEQARTLGTGASGKLEGWYHSGALYGGLEDRTCFDSAVAATGELHRAYALDDGFEFRAACNVEAPSSSDPARQWFHGPIDFLLPSASLTHDATRGGPTRQQRMVHRIGGPRTGTAHSGDARPVPGTVEDTLRRLGNHAGALAAATRRRSLARQIRVADVDALPTRDRVMNARQILSDLAHCAQRRGVHVRTGSRVEAILPMRSGARREAVIVDAAGKRLRVRARQIVISAGGGLNAAGSSSLVQRRRSVMVVTPAPLTTVSIVNVGERHEDDFSHIYHPTAEGGYSVIADSSSSEPDACAGVDQSAVDALMRKAERFFGAQVWQGRSAAWYACTKAEPACCAQGTQFMPWIDRSDPTVLNVLPGKFSNFPTLARDVSQELEARGVFTSLQEMAPPHAEHARVELGFAHKLARQLRDQDAAPPSVSIPTGDRQRQVQLAPPSRWINAGSTQNSPGRMPDNPPICS